MLKLATSDRLMGRQSTEALRPATDREPLSGLVERVTYHNADNGFCVLRLKVRGHRDLVTLVGSAASVAPGAVSHRKRSLGHEPRSWSPVSSHVSAIDTAKHDRRHRAI